MGSHRSAAPVFAAPGQPSSSASPSTGESCFESSFLSEQVAFERRAVRLIGRPDVRAALDRLAETWRRGGPGAGGPSAGPGLGRAHPVGGRQRPVTQYMIEKSCSRHGRPSRATASPSTGATTRRPCRWSRRVVGNNLDIGMWATPRSSGHREHTAAQPAQRRRGPPALRDRHPGGLAAPHDPGPEGQDRRDPARRRPLQRLRPDAALGARQRQPARPRHPARQHPTLPRPRRCRPARRDLRLLPRSCRPAPPAASRS